VVVVEEEEEVVVDETTAFRYNQIVSIGAPITHPPCLGHSLDICSSKHLPAPMKARAQTCKAAVSLGELT
jgi:hypothetical protein